MFKILKRAAACALSFAVLFSFSACDNEENTGDALSGNKWETTSGMMLDFGKDGSFKWYNSKSDRKDNYYSGDFTVKSGQEAIDFIEESQGFPEESQRSAMVKFSIPDDCYYSVELNNKECIQDGKNTLEEENTVVYYGYYLPDYETLKLYNLNNLTPYEFTKM
ncbi:MAG: hypothetical protein NC320_00600 [Clostridium sp.]|nr:hypothetical protein [Clostridium sp.]MCM1546842.1 hypothetical protein [Ruminococcus sp.]